ncbi:MAG: YceI family protein [Pseudomonadota bacterium]
MIRTAAAVIALAVASVAHAAPERYELDEDHLTVAFFVSHIGFKNQLGVFREVEGEFTYDATSQALSDLRVEIEADSVDTFNSARDRHVRDDDFLAADEHPTISFVMTSAEALTETSGTVTGDLTIRGVTRPVTLDVTLNRAAEYPFGHEAFTLGISAKGMVKRSEFGSTYALEGGLVGDEVEIVIEAEAIQQ